MIKNIVLSFLVLTPLTMCSQSLSEPIYLSAKYKIYGNKVVQDNFTAVALSPMEITSDYQSPVNQFMKSTIDFKFSINGKDNEMISGKDHHFSCIASNGKCETPLIRFGEQFNDPQTVPAGTYLNPDTEWIVRLDMRKVFEEFENKGFYETFNGSKIYKADFKGVYIAGGTSPLTWDFDNLHNYSHLQLQDADGDHIYEHKLIMNATSQKKSTNPRWKLSSDTKMYPQYSSPHIIVDALYNLSLDEMNNAIEKDSTLRTGKEWAGVWTRDVSYSIILSMAVLQPKVAQYSLMRKVKDGVIVQDTGTGGAYPISTDRMVWAIAAYEIYKVTGDMEWLRKIYPIIKKSLEADQKNAYDESTGLVKGESSFLDWREQTYPEWMEPADIYESLCLGTNAVHYQANEILASIANTLGVKAEASTYIQRAEQIKTAINKHLWIADKKYYGQFLYGRTFKILSPKSEALGEALCVLYDIADRERQSQIVTNTPVNDYGIPCIYPQIPNMPPYHNNAVWPFVQSYWAMAAAKAGNEASVMHSLASIWRPAALFLTNKENFVSSTGDYASTQINSDNMLWSLSGNISMIYKVLFGIHYNENSIEMRPFVPEALKGRRSLQNFRYRKAILDLEMEGFGNVIKRVTLDGKPLRKAEIPGNLTGRHVIRIVLDEKKIGGTINPAPHLVSPVSPVTSISNSVLSWSKNEDAVHYKVLKNGSVVKTAHDTTLPIQDDGFAEYQVIAVSRDGAESFATAPVVIAIAKNTTTIELENQSPIKENEYKGYSGDGYVRTSPVKSSEISFDFNAMADGTYVIDFRYANGHGPVNTENKCAIRTFHVDGKKLSTVVLPQRGRDEWSDWGYSNSVSVELKKGSHQFSLTYEAYNANMNGTTNEAVIDFARIIQVK